MNYNELKIEYGKVLAERDELKSIGDKMAAYLSAVAVENAEEKTWRKCSRKIVAKWNHHR